ncbi:MAG TPA: guanylate kinase [Syntrophobacteria bacterium]|nr:guanylate kinase [Syntrophobacteria bacterium]
MEYRGQLFVLSGPSGAGKSTLRERIRKRFSELWYSVSCTTRAPRAGEIDGEDYAFVSTDAFLAMVRARGFLEWAQVHGNYYGTPREPVVLSLENGRDVLLEIDVQGARQVKIHLPQACFIFVLPPTVETLKKRLRRRGTEHESEMKIRLDQARREMAEAPWYDYLVINDDLERASEELAAVIMASRCRAAAVLPRALDLVRPDNT